jgi:hypothetical protein
MDIDILKTFLKEVNNGKWDTLHPYFRGAWMKKIANSDPLKTWGIGTTQIERKPKDSSYAGTQLVEYFRINSSYLNKVPNRINNTLFMSLDLQYVKQYGNNVYLIFLRKSDRNNIKYTSYDTLSNIDGIAFPFHTTLAEPTSLDKQLTLMKQLPMFKKFYNIIILRKDETASVEELLQWLIKNKITFIDFFKEKTHVSHITKDKKIFDYGSEYSISYLFIQLYESIERYFKLWNSIWDGSSYHEHYEIVANVKDYLYINKDIFRNYLITLDSGEIIFSEDQNIVNEWKNNWDIGQEII